MSDMVVDYKSYKWLVSSCLQKSLRRGRFDLAENCVRFLWEHDRSYITYRFGTILTEDVGIANLPLVKEYLDTNLAKRKIDDAGGLDFLLRLTQEACESVKDRSSCDVANFATYFNFSKEEKSLEDIFLDPKEAYADRINASWIVLGNKRFKHEGLDFSEDYPVNEKGDRIDNLDKYVSLLVKMGLDENFISVVRSAYATQIENMCLGLPIVESLYQKEKSEGTSKIEVGKTIENTYIKEESYMHPVLGFSLVSSGLDGHTREGKGVYYAFLKTQNKFNQYMKEKNVDYDKQLLIFSHCMFRVEGHEVNKRLYFPSAVNIMRDCEQTILNIKAGRDDLDFNTMKKILIEEMPKINQLREKAVLNAKPSMIAAVEPKRKKKL